MHGLYDWEIYDLANPLKASVDKRSYFCRHRTNKDMVARITLYNQNMGEIEDLSLFRQRMRQLRRLGDENDENNEYLLDSGIVRVDGPVGPEKRLFTVSNLSEHIGLDDLYSEHHTMSFAEMCICMQQLTRALTFAHRRKVFHQNIRLESIFCKQRIADASTAPLEASPLILGYYHPFEAALKYYPTSALLDLAPEQIKSGGTFGMPSLLTDIFQVATVLYKGFTGQWPLDVRDITNTAEVIRAICRKEPRLTGMPPQLHPPFSRALARQPGERYSDINAFYQDFEEAAEEYQSSVNTNRRVFGPPALPRRGFLKVTIKTLTVVVGGLVVLEIAEGITGAQHVVTATGTFAPLSATTTGTPVQQFYEEGSQLTIAIPSSNGSEIVTGSATGQLTIRVVASKQEHTLPPAQAAIVGLAFSEDDKYLLSCDEAGHASLRNVETNKVEESRISHAARSLAWSSSEQYLLVNDGSRALVFKDIVEKFGQADLKADFTYSGHSATVNCLAFLTNNRAISASSDTTVQIWDRDSAATLSIYTNHKAEVLTVAATGDGSLVASGDKTGVVQIWPTDSLGNPPFSYTHQGAVNAVAWSPDGQHVASGGDDKLANVYDVHGVLTRVYRGHKDPIVSIAWLNNTYVLSTSANEIHIWSIE